MAQRRQVRDGSGLATAIAMVLLLGLLLLPALIVLLLYLFFTIMSMVEGTDFRASTLDLPIVFTGIAVIVATLALLPLVGASLIGRSLTPRRPGRRD